MTRHASEEQPVLVLGGTGFVGREVVRLLLGRGFAVRVLARTPDRARGHLPTNVEIAHGDIYDVASLTSAMHGTRAVVVSVQAVTTAQSNSTRSLDAMEQDAARALIAAAQATGVRRVVTIGVIGSSRQAGNRWARARGDADAVLLESGLAVTILRPGLVAGAGSLGFDGIVRAASHRLAIITGSGKQRWRIVAVGDLAALCIDVLDDERTFGHAYDVGSDDVATYDDLVDRAARVRGSRPPRKLHVPIAILKLGASVIERVRHLTPGGLIAAIDQLEDDLVGDVAQIRAIAPRRFSGWEETVACNSSR